MRTGVNRTETYTGLALLLFAIWYGCEAYALPRVNYPEAVEAFVYPLVLAVIYGLLALLLTIKGLRGDPDGIGQWVPSRAAVAQIAFLFVALAVYIILFQHLGYIASTFLFMMVVLKYIDRQRPLVGTLAIALLFTGVCYAIFALIFKVPFPSGLLV